MSARQEHPYSTPSIETTPSFPESESADQTGHLDVQRPVASRHRVQFSFSLRCFLAFVMVLGVLFAWAAWKIRQGERQQRAVELILSKGRFNGVVYAHQWNQGPPIDREATVPGPVWLHRILGEDCFIEVDYVQGDFDEESLAALTQFDKLRELSISGVEVNDDALRHISALHSLDRLQIGDCPVTDSGLRHIESLKQLTFLNLALDNMTDEGIRHLAPLRRLRFLQLCPPMADTEDWVPGQIRGLGFKYCPEFPDLEELRLNGMPIEDEALQYIAQYRKLKTLDLSRTSIRGPGLAYLRVLPELRSVHLTDTRISDNAVVHMKELKQIRFLALPEGRISPKVFEELPAALPDCNVGLY